MLGSKAADRLMTNQKISENEVLEGHSIISLRQEQVWSITRPQGQIERNSPTLPPRNSGGGKVNKSHLVVVQTPDATPHM